jgi:hypothetical protein
MLLPLCISHNERYEYKVNNEKKFEVPYFFGTQTNSDFFILTYLQFHTTNTTNTK